MQHIPIAFNTLRLSICFEDEAVYYEPLWDILFPQYDPDGSIEHAMDLKWQDWKEIADEL